MPRTAKLLCLANSDKHGNRCIAGLDLDTGDWIRPVSDTDDGGLRGREYITEENHDPEPLDIVEFTLTEPSPDPHQPENWLIADESPTRHDTEIGDHEARVLLDSIHSESHLFGDTHASMKNPDIIKSPVDSSLELVRPEAPQLKIREREGKPDQPRAVFDLQGTEYDLPITDPAWKRDIKSNEILSGMDLEFEPASAYTSGDERPLFTISLGSPHDGKCYKLVAAIIPVPRAVIDYIDTG